jgi:acetyl esterase/lipase
MKGVKAIFNQPPLNYNKLRKDNCCFSKSSISNNRKITFFTINKTTITEIHSKTYTNKLLVYLHGGAFVSGPAKHHWDAFEKIAIQTNFTVWMCNYPKAPEHKIQEISNNIDHVFELASTCFKDQNIVFMGDSVGATLIIALVQRLIKRGIGLPSKLILISPVMDASFENPLIDILENKDPMLSKKGVMSAKAMCAGNLNLKDSMISPIYDSLEGFPETVLFMAENDITQPDQELFAHKLKASKVKHKVYFGRAMPHIWPLLPFMKESKVAFDEIIDLINNTLLIQNIMK